VTMNGAPLLSVDQWKSIMKQAADAGLMYVTLTGGECLTYPGFKELYLFLRSCGIMEISILSNGVLVTDEVIEFLLDHRPYIIQISLYGASEDAYERVTGHRVFHRVLANILKLRDAGLRVQTVITPSAYMTDGADILRLMHKEGIRCDVNSGLSQPREETGRSIANIALDEQIALHKLDIQLTGKRTGTPCELDALPRPGGNQTDCPTGTLCAAGRRYFAIDWRGGMRPCNTFPCQPHSVLELGFAEAWERTRHTAKTYARPVECHGCAYRDFCKICAAEHAAGAEQGHANPQICEWVQRMVAEGIYSLK